MGVKYTKSLMNLDPHVEQCLGMYHWEDNQPARFSHSKRLLVSKFTHEQWATSDLVCLQLLYCLHFIIISGALKGGLRVYGLPICGFHSRAGTWCVKFYSKQANYLGISVLYYICAWDQSSYKLCILPVCRILFSGSVTLRGLSWATILGSLSVLLLQ